MLIFTHRHSLPIDLTTSWFGEMNYPVGSTSHQVQMYFFDFFCRSLLWRSPPQMNHSQTWRFQHEAGIDANLPKHNKCNSAKNQPPATKGKTPVTLVIFWGSLLVTGSFDRWENLHEDEHFTELRTSQNQFHLRLVPGWRWRRVRKKTRLHHGNPFELWQSILEQFSGKPWHENMACPIAWHWNIIEKVLWYLIVT